MKDNRIKELRISKQMKQSDLAKLLNCSPTTVSNYEVGYRSTGGLQLTPEEENIILALRRADTRAIEMVNVALAPFKQEESSSRTASTV